MMMMNESNSSYSNNIDDGDEQISIDYRSMMIALNIEFLILSFS